MGTRVAMDLVSSLAMTDVLAPYDLALTEPLLTSRVVAEVRRLSLIAFDDDARQIELSRFVQAVVRSRMTEQQAARVREDVHEILLAARPVAEVDDPDAWDDYQMIWPHLEPTQVAGALDDRVRQLIIDRVRYWQVIGEYEASRAEAAAAEDRWEELLASAPPAGIARPLLAQLLELRFHRANSLRSAAQFEAARALDESVLAGQGELLGLDHPQTLATACGIARDLLCAGEYEQAADRAERAYHVLRESQGLDSIETLKGQWLLGVALRNAGRVDNAGTHLAEALRGITERLGSGNVVTLTCRAAYSVNMLSQGRLAEADSEIRALLADYQQTLGTAHPHALACQVNLAAALRVTLSPDRAGEVLAPALADLPRVLGAKHPYTLIARMTEGVLLSDKGFLERSADLTDSTAGAMAEVLGADHPDTLCCRANVLLIREQWGEEAAEEREQVLARLERLIGPGRPDDTDGSQRRVPSPCHRPTLTCRRLPAVSPLGKPQPHLQQEALLACFLPVLC